MRAKKKVGGGARKQHFFFFKHHEPRLYCAVQYTTVLAISWRLVSLQISRLYYYTINEMTEFCDGLFAFICLGFARSSVMVLARCTPPHWSHLLRGCTVSFAFASCAIMLRSRPVEPLPLARCTPPHCSHLLRGCTVSFAFASCAGLSPLNASPHPRPQWLHTRFCVRLLYLWNKIYPPR